jgi:hypothetical protein
MAAITSACSASEPEALVSGFDVSAAIDVGQSFEMRLPIREGTTLQLVSAPDDVDVMVFNEPAVARVGVDVRPSAQPGDYVLRFLASDDSEQAEYEWPFMIVTGGLGDAEGVRESLLIFVEGGNEEALRTALPTEAWDSFGSTLVGGFVPGETPPCEAVGEQRARCLVFEDGAPRVLALTIENQGTGWFVSGASLESTD